MKTDELSLTKYWLKEIVIGLDLCPFAKKPFENNLIGYSVCRSKDPVDWYLSFIEMIDELNQKKPSLLSNSLLILPKAPNSFLPFHDFVGSLEDWLSEHQLAELFQLVSFHPEFIFKGLPESARGHFVNRSPYPTIHILRSEEVLLAMKSIDQGESISLINDKKLNALKESEFKKLFSYLTNVT